MDKYTEIRLIKDAILRGNQTYKGFDLPSFQTSGTGTQRSGHANQLATSFYENNLFKFDIIKSIDKIEYFKGDAYLSGDEIDKAIHNIKESLNFKKEPKNESVFNKEISELKEEILQVCEAFRLGDFKEILNHTKQNGFIHVYFRAVSGNYKHYFKIK